MKAVINYYTYNKRTPVTIRTTFYMENGKSWGQLKKFK